MRVDPEREEKRQPLQAFGPPSSATEDPEQRREQDDREDLRPDDEDASPESEERHSHGNIAGCGREPVQRRRSGIVPTITLTDLLDAERAPHVDFLSMDIELHEPTALRGLDIERFKPSLVCVEALLPARQQILNYFAEHRYVVVGKYVWSDLENLYFAPVDEMTETSVR